MDDVVYIAALLAFFTICALYVQACDRMIGGDEVTTADAAGDDVAAAGVTATMNAASSLSDTEVPA